MNAQKNLTELARLVSLDIGKEVTPAEVRAYLLAGDYPERLDDEDRSDMRATLFKELLS